MGVLRCCLVPCGALALVFALLAGIWLRELAVFREALPGAEWVNWIGEFSCGPGVEIARPSSLKELQSVVRKHSSLRAAATGHSFNPFACPADRKGAVVDMTAFRQVEVKALPAGGHAVSAEAGIKMGNLQNTILAKGLTLRVPPGNSAYTLGGCIATGCHNLGQSHAQDLLAVTLVLHNGTVVEVSRGDPDFGAAAVSLGRLGVILRVTLEVLPYRSLQWTSEMHPVPTIPDTVSRLQEMSRRQTSQETVGNKLVFYLATQVMMVEHWVPDGRAAELQEAAEPLPPYVNPQPFRLGQGPFSAALYAWQRVYFGNLPLWVNTMLQVPAESAFRALHSSAALAGLRKALGWQHSPEARGEASARPSPNLFTWAGFLDEVTNLLMGLRHVEVIFPLEPADRAAKCLEAVFAHRHLAWWRLNVRTQPSEDFLLSSTHSPGARVVFARVDFVAPGALMELPSGEASLTARLRKDCPGWRKHWGKGLFATSAEERWGDPGAFLKVAKRWDPAGKFTPRDMPKWLGA